MKKRNTGINLFKLFSMFMIALLHVLGIGRDNRSYRGNKQLLSGLSHAECGILRGQLLRTHQRISYARQKDKAVEDNRICGSKYFSDSARSVRDYDINIPRIFQRAEYSLCTDSDNFKSVLVHDRVFSDVFIHPDDEQIRRGGR